MKLIVIEGLDGAGKSTQITLLKEWFDKKGLPHRSIHFPRTEKPFFGELIARFLRGEFGEITAVDPYLVAMLFAGDRRDAAAQIKSWLNEKYYVILDRYTYSNIAYQCAKTHSAPEAARLREWIMELEFEHFGIPRPDLNIFLDVPFRFTREKLNNVRRGSDRSYLMGGRDIHESSLSFQQRVRDIYAEVAAIDDSLQMVSCGGPDGDMLPAAGIFEMILERLIEKKIVE